MEIKCSAFTFIQYLQKSFSFEHMIYLKDVATPAVPHLSASSSVWAPKTNTRIALCLVILYLFYIKSSKEVI